jgi:DNA-binding transcriptional regulator YhcF (GntR family)
MFDHERERREEGSGSAFRGYDFTEEVRRALANAREEARRLRHGFVGTEHILLALTRQQSGGAARLLSDLGLDIGQVQALVEVEATRIPDSRSASGPRDHDAPYTSRAKKVLELAMRQAHELEHAYVGTEHLLLGLIEENDGIAGQVLHRLGITLKAAQVAAYRRLAPRAAPTFRVTIDDGSDRSIYEQIVDRVREGVATGQLRPGDRLPTVRQLADDLDVAPGTVARAFADLERHGVVVTEGTRGTRIASGERRTTPASARSDVLVGLLRPAAVAAFHLGATARELREAMAVAMHDIYGQTP